MGFLPRSIKMQYRPPARDKFKNSMGYLSFFAYVYGRSESIMYCRISYVHQITAWQQRQR